MGMVLSNQIGTDVLGIRFIGDMEEQKQAYQNMIKYGFLPICLNGHLLQYDYGKILGSSGYQTILGKLSQFGELTSLSNVSRGMILKFVTENPGQRTYLTSERVDRDVSPVIIKNGEIMGVMYSCIFGESHISFPYGYISKDIRYELAVPALFVCAIKLAGQKFERHGKVILFPSFEKGYQGMCGILGAPEEECLANEYYTICESEEKLNFLRIKLEEYNKLHNVIPEKSEILSGYFKNPESTWITSATASRIPFLDNLSFMPKTLLTQYTSFLRERLDSWGFNVEYEINRILLASMRRKKRIDIETIDYFENEECQKIYELYKKGEALPEVDIERYDISEIEFCLAGEDANGIFDVIPEHLKPELHNRDFIIICAFTPRRQLIGLSMLGRSEQYRRVVNLEFLYLVKSYQTQEFAREFMLRSMATAQYQCMDYFYVRNVLNIEDKEFIQADDNNTEYLLGYSLRRVMTQLKTYDTARVVTVENRNSILPCRCDELREREGLVFFSDSYDTCYQMFVTYGQNLMGTICARQITENEIAIFDYWISERNRDEELMAKMLYAVLEKSSRLMTDDTRLLIRVADDGVNELICSILGPEESRLKYMEQMYILDNHRESMQLKGVYVDLPGNINVIPLFLEKIHTDEEKHSVDMSLVIRDSMMLNAIPGLYSRSILKYFI